MPRDRVRVAPPGVAGEYTADGERAELGRPYVLSLATLEPRKNLETLAEAWRTLRGELALAVAGAAGWGDQPFLDGAGILRLGFVADGGGAAADTAARPCSSTRLASRASACRSSRRWPAACRWSPRRTRRWTRPAATPLCVSIPNDPRCDRRRDPRAHWSAVRSCARPGSRTPRSSLGARCGEIHLAAYEEAAAGEGRARRRAARADPRRHGALGPRPARARSPSVADVERDAAQLGRGGPVAAVARDVLWYPVLLAASGRERRVGSTCCTARSSAAPLRARVPTIGDACTTSPCFGIPRSSRSGRGSRPNGARARRSSGRSRRRRLGVHEARGCRAARASIRTGSMSSRTRVEPVFRSDGDAAEGDYVLAVGTLEPRKNLARVVEAHRAGRRRAAVVGAPGWGDAGGRRRTWLARQVPDEELALLYRGARVPRLSLALRGLRHPRARGDGVRHAGRDERRRRDGGGRRRRGGPRRPARRRVDRRRDRGRPTGGATSCARSASSVRGRFTWERAADAVEPPLAGARMTEPLVVVDADVLGRRRTGDETYVRQPAARARLARAGAGLPDRRGDAAPRARPGRDRAARARGRRSQELRMALGAAAAAPPARRGARAHAVRAAARAAVPGRRHDPRPLVRARAGADGPRRTGSSSAGSSRARRGSAARVLTVSERTRRDLARALRHPGREGRRDAERRRPRLHARNSLCTATTSSPSARCRSGRTSSRRSRPPTRPGCRSSSRARRRTRRSRASSAARRAHRRGYVAQAELVELYRGAACLVQPSRYEGFGLPGARGDGVRDARRRGRRAGAAGGGRRRCRLGRGARARRRDPPRASPSASASSRPGSSGRGSFSWRATAERTLEVYREALGR